MAAVSRPRAAKNAPCPCGSGRKYKRCCLRNGGSTHQHLPAEPLQTISPKDKESVWEIKYNVQNPPCVFFDTNVWFGVNKNDADALKHLQRFRKFRYRYSFINFIELVSHLGDVPSTECTDPFSSYKTRLLRMVKMCEVQILPLAEEQFMRAAGLMRYIGQEWVVNPDSIQEHIKLIESAQTKDEVREIVEYYKGVKDCDERSMEKLWEDLKSLPEIKKPLLEEDTTDLINWFRNFAYHFLLARPTNGQKKYTDLNQDERRRIDHEVVIRGRLYTVHCAARIRKILRDGMKARPNDIYDMLQLVHIVYDDNLLFVTADKAFGDYNLGDPLVQRVLPWDAFRMSK